MVEKRNENCLSKNETYRHHHSVIVHFSSAPPTCSVLPESRHQVYNFSKSKCAHPPAQLTWVQFCPCRRPFSTVDPWDHVSHLWKQMWEISFWLKSQLPPSKAKQMWKQIYDILTWKNIWAIHSLSPHGKREDTWLSTLWSTFRLTVPKCVVGEGCGVDLQETSWSNHQNENH